MRCRGATLLEVLVAAGVGLLVLGLLVTLLLGGVRIYLHGSTRSELQVGATLALGRLIADLERSTWTGVSLCHDGLGLVPVKGVSADGRLLWREALILYHHQAAPGLLWRRECPPVPGGLSLALEPTRPLQLNANELGAIFSASARDSTGWAVVAREVSRFELTRAGPPGLLRVTLELLRVTPGGAELRFELIRDLCLRNP